MCSELLRKSAQRAVSTRMVASILARYCLICRNCCANWQSLVALFLLAGCHAGRGRAAATR
jgi:hypothetical protein